LKFWAAVPDRKWLFP